MLKIQEIEIDGEKFRLREPRLADYLRARKADKSDFVFVMLEGMLLNEEGKEVGQEAVQNLPLRVFDVLADAVNTMATPRSGPLEKSDGSSTDSPSQSEQPSLTLN